MRALYKRISKSHIKGIAIEDQAKWQKEREILLESRMYNDGIFPPMKSDIELGGPAPVPEYSAFRVTHRYNQWPINFSSLGRYQIQTQVNIFCQTFSDGVERNCIIKDGNTRAFDEAIFFGLDEGLKLRTQCILVDFSAIPDEIDCLIFGLLIPTNCPALIESEERQSVSCTGMVEILPVDILTNEWTRPTWPDWEDESPDRIELAEKDQLKIDPVFFNLNAAYSTYFSQKELGYCNGYIWGKCCRSQKLGTWLFHPIREAVDAKTVREMLPTMKAFLPPANHLLGNLSDSTLLLKTPDPLATLSVDCYRYDRFGFQLGEVVSFPHQARGKLEIKLKDVLIPDCSSIWVVWTGKADPSVSAQINQFQAVDFQGGEKNILYRLTCQGVGKPYAFPSPKQEKWIAVPVFRPYASELVPIFEEYQPVADKLLVTVVSGNNLHKAGTFGGTPSPYVTVNFGAESFRSPSKKKTVEPNWQFACEFPITQNWREQKLEFHVFHQSLAKAPLGMAEYELGTMRIPFGGDLRLRPFGIHERSTVSGNIIVTINVTKKNLDAIEEVKLENK